MPEEEAIDQLVSAQRKSQVTLKPNDKSGGCSVLDVQDYKTVCYKQLEASYKGPDGNQLQYYCTTCQQILNHQLAIAKDLVQEGVEGGFIHPDDAKQMVPDQAKPGRYYGLVKNHKDKESWPAGQNIPPLRPVVSNSGSVSEGISH